MASANDGWRDTIDKLFRQCGRQTFIKINLDAILHNYDIIKERCEKHTEIIAVVKGNAYGHGLVVVSKTLQGHGCTNFAVAMLQEGRELREAGIKGMVQVLGVAAEADIPTLVKHVLTPTVSDRDFLEQVSQYQNNNIGHCSKINVIIEVNIGLNRSGCHVKELPELIEFCRSAGIGIHSVMGHFTTLSEKEPCAEQLVTFLDIVEPIRKQGIKVHIASSGSITYEIGTDLDFVRPGLALYGQPFAKEKYVQLSKNIGFKPALTWLARPILVRTVTAGDTVGYGGYYVCKTDEQVAMLPVGFVDGFPRQLSGQKIISDENGFKFETIGTLSMDSLMLKVEPGTTRDTVFYMITDDLDTNNCPTALAKLQNTAVSDILGRLNTRVPRIYQLNGEIVQGKQCDGLSAMVPSEQ